MIDNVCSFSYSCKISGDMGMGDEHFVFSVDITRFLKLIEEPRVTTFPLLLQINNNLRHPDEMFWNHVSMCILNGGSIRSPIDEKNNGMLLGPAPLAVHVVCSLTVPTAPSAASHKCWSFEFALAVTQA